MTVKEALIGGVKTAPTIGVIVGTQMVVQNAVEKKLIKTSENSAKPSFASMLFSSALVGVISAPPLAVFNGQTMGRKVMESLRLLSGKQIGAIVFRETSFLFSLRISGPISVAMKKISGDNKSLDYCSAFVSGAVGSVIEHPADTALTLWQKGMKVESFRQSLRGAPVKAITVGGFSVIYKMTKEFFESLS